ncbi:hypothetical protein [Winogradskyella vidalii]|uniref:hypothetical protein n=1 Tax=Winogradskyella vidalii TaxID=2615024 RepID=UPI0015C95B57|nr:hypothetical protein [Winogradskyella vidalii]
MKKSFSILLFVISSQILLAHPGADHTHDTFMGEWAWLLVPAVALVAFLIWKFNSKSESKKSEN